MLLVPQGSVATTSNGADSWYTIQAGATRGTADVDIFGDIGNGGVTAQQFANDLRAIGDVSQINLRINSPGGAVFEGMAMYNLLKHHKARKVGTVMGLAASMGSVVAMACDELRMPSNAMMMVHMPWGIQGGNAEAMRKYAEVLDMFGSSMLEAYTSKTGKSTEEIEALLKEETWMLGAEAVTLGFADVLLEPVEAFGKINSNRMKDFTKMPQAAFQMFTAPQGSTTVVPPPAAQPPAPATLTPEQIAAQTLAADGVRRTAIQAAFAPFAGHESLRDTCLTDTACTVEQANAKLLAAIGQGTTPTGSVRHPGHVTNGNIVGDSVRASLYARVGVAEMQADNRFNNMTMRELARASLQERGIGVSTLNIMDMVGLAFTHSSSDFGNILMDASRKSLLEGWENADETYHLWTKKGRLSDFKPTNRVGLGSFSSLREVRPGAEYKHITIGDSGAVIQLATYGELFTIDRTAIINDDLDALTRIPKLMGEAARATIGDLVYAILTDNPKMADGKALFDATRNNLFTAGSKLSLAALSAAKTAMRLQPATVAKGQKARPLNIQPAFVLCPVALEDMANQIIRSASAPGTDTNAGIDNPIRNFAKVIAEPRLDANSSSAYYQAAKLGSDTVEVAYLDGVEEPYFETKEGFTSDGIATKVRIDAGVSALDARGLNKSTGAN